MEKCICCEKYNKEASHGGEYCNNPDCPLYELINPVFVGGLSKKVDHYRFVNKLKD
jgi:hypothetical protein